MNKYKFVLASKSPRRSELIGHLKIPFEIQTEHVEEHSNETDNSEVVMDLSVQKGEIVYKTSFTSEKDYFIVSSDTIVALDGEILGKPTSRENAKEMLLKLSGRTHTVFTGVAIHYYSFKEGAHKVKKFYDSTDVEFESITDDLLDAYLNTGDSLDKAGAYGIQGSALTFIKRLEGSYSSVMGFPLNLFVNKMKEILLEELDSEVLTDCFI